MQPTTYYLPELSQWQTSTISFAGLPLPSVEPTPQQLSASAARLAASAQTLRAVPIGDVVAAIDRAVQRWQQPDFAPRHMLLETLPAINGYSRAMLEHVVDRMLADWRANVLWQRLHDAFGNPAVLDDWQTSSVGLSRAFGPRLTWHVCAGNVPGVAIQSLLDALLVKSPSLVKTASGEPLWTAAFVRTLVEELPCLADALAVLWWRGGDAAREQAVLHHCEAVIANASNHTINDVRQRLPSHVRLIDYGSRISFSVISREMLNAEHINEIAQKLAYDVSMFEQRGCVSPQMVFVERGGDLDADTLSRALADAMHAINAQFPHQPDAEQRQAVRQLHDELEWREFAGESISSISDVAGAWTIVHDTNAPFAPTIGGRTIVLRDVEDLHDLPSHLAQLSNVLQSAAIAAPPQRTVQLATALAAVGVSRITTIGAQSFPNPLWHHDGRNPLQALVRWSDIETAVKRNQV